MPLDIAFIDADCLVVGIQKMNPLPLTTVYASPVPASTPWKSIRAGSKKTASASAMSSNSTCRSRWTSAERVLKIFALGHTA